MTRRADIAAVVIGRNEGARLIACLDALAGQVGRVIYVDSGSTDGSQQAAIARGAEVVVLDTDRPFTAARARNAGLAHLLQDTPAPAYVQFLDGDCALHPGWIETARVFLDGTPLAAVACGRRRERFPEASIYNRLIDAEWDTALGRTRSCGGDALMRLTALAEVGGYNPDLIAGEEPELCVRLRAAGWRIVRLDADMTLHDAAMTRFGQWWARSRRAGHAFAEGAALHGAPPERHWVAETRRALLWGALLPAGIVIAAPLVPWFGGVLVLAYPLQVLRLSRHWPLERAMFTVLGKFPEALGALGYYLGRLSGRRRGIMDYK